MSENSSTMPGSSAPPITDPVTQISAAVHRIVPGAGADELVAQIASILASAVPEDMERVALENAQLQHELELLQSVDPLTGLRNRGRFFEELRRAGAAARRDESPVASAALDVAG